MPRLKRGQKVKVKAFDAMIINESTGQAGSPSYRVSIKSGIDSRHYAFWTLIPEELIEILEED